MVVDASLRGLSSENRMHSVALEEDGRTLLRELMHNEPAELSVVLCSDEEMTMLNKEWCGKDQPTDVLSFPQNDEVVRIFREFLWAQFLTRAFHVGSW